MGEWMDEGLRAGDNSDQWYVNKKFRDLFLMADESTAVANVGAVFLECVRECYYVSTVAQTYCNRLLFYKPTKLKKWKNIFCPISKTLTRQAQFQTTFS